MEKNIYFVIKIKSLSYICDRDYFGDQTKENYITRSDFEYIRDHLGYRLTLEEAAYPFFVKVGDYFDLKFNLKNYGFSRPVNVRPIAIVLLDEQHEMKWQFFCLLVLRCVLRVGDIHLVFPVRLLI
ncbi:DUF4832 domain-containing protein [Arsenophonus endosymbiont of Bemisia tabaci]|uniref:DUF4832 domain-containing protein n=1 Tax=Arsenophonus endosymbiont of Bemisia tabaci TaxID=536059 RepID=UPI0015F41928|nr:DUF4832 domain-containing protein [Arsenophonus endosymbiont of Bemisia tabaci]